MNMNGCLPHPALALPRTKEKWLPHSSCGGVVSSSRSADEFNSSEIVPNASGTGWNARSSLNKTKKYGVFCVVPMPPRRGRTPTLPGQVDANSNQFLFYNFIIRF